MKFLVGLLGSPHDRFPSMFVATCFEGFRSKSMTPFPILYTWQQNSLTGPPKPGGIYLETKNPYRHWNGLTGTGWRIKHQKVGRRSELQTIPKSHQNHFAIVTRDAEKIRILIGLWDKIKHPSFPLGADSDTERIPMPPGRVDFMTAAKVIWE
jgi:hypothetical protein